MDILRSKNMIIRAIYYSNVSIFKFEKKMIIIRLRIQLYGYIYQTPPLGQDMTQGQFFKRSLTDLNSEFSFS